MKAIIIKETGGVENLHIVEIDKPKVNENEVLIETKAIGVNPVDYKVRANEDLLTAIYGEKRPAILGWDIAGVVVETGKNVSKFSKGDRVFGMVNFVGAGNTYAEFVAAPENHLAKIPDTISFQDAAASTLAALTALQVLQGNIGKNDKVLIHAGSGGVGHFAIQIAKNLGAYVISTSSAKNKHFIKTLGADEHIDYHKTAFQNVLNDLDFVFDMFNGEILLNSIKVTKPGGKIISIPTPEFSEEAQNMANQKEIDLAFHMVQSSGEGMDTIAKLLENGEINPHVSKLFSFEEMAEAHKYLESGRTVGKVVLQI